MVYLISIFLLMLGSIARMKFPVLLQAVQSSGQAQLEPRLIPVNCCSVCTGASEQDGHTGRAGCSSQNGRAFSERETSGISECMQVAPWPGRTSAGICTPCRSLVLPLKQQVLHGALVCSPKASD